MMLLKALNALRLPSPLLQHCCSLWATKYTSKLTRTVLIQKGAVGKQLKNCRCRETTAEFFEEFLIVTKDKINELEISILMFISIRPYGLKQGIQGTEKGKFTKQLHTLNKGID